MKNSYSKTTIVFIFALCTIILLIGTIKKSYASDENIDIVWNVVLVRFDPTTFWTWKTGGFSVYTGYIQLSHGQTDILEQTKNMITELKKDILSKNDNGVRYKISDSYEWHVQCKEKPDKEYLVKKIDKINNYILTSIKGEYKITESLKSDVRYFIRNYGR